MLKPDSRIFNVSRASGLKVVKVVLSHKGNTLETYAILDDGSERSMLMSSAAESLGLHGAAESLVLRTIRQDTEKIEGATVSFSIQSFPTTKEAKEILMKLRSSLAEGDFEIQQWASNHISVIDHLPTEARSVNTDLW